MGHLVFAWSLLVCGSLASLLSVNSSSRMFLANSWRDSYWIANVPVNNLISTSEVSSTTPTWSNFSLFPDRNASSIHVIIATDVDAETETLYTMARYFNGAVSIFKASYNGNVQAEVIKVDADPRYGSVKVASVGGAKKIYYVTGGLNELGSPVPVTIKRADLDGSNVEVIFQSNATMLCRPVYSRLECPDYDSIDQLAVDERMGYIYFNVRGGSLHRMPITPRSNETAATRTDIEMLARNGNVMRDVKFSNGILYWLEDPEVGDYISRDQIWKWSPTYDGRPWNATLRANMSLLGEVRQPYIQAGRRGQWQPAAPAMLYLATDPAHNEIWGVGRSGGAYKVSMDGGNMTKVALAFPANRTIVDAVIA